jgi:hypothetical protein
MTAETVFHAIIYLLIFATSIVAAFFYYSRRQWAALVIVGGLITRLAVALLMNTGLKYFFVIDSMRFEQNAWLLAQRWITPDVYSALANAQMVGHFNLYEVFLSGVFSNFGLDPLLATFINSMFAGLTILLIYLIQTQFIYVRSDEARSINPAVITALILGLYPSFVIWSATNVRDPLYFMACVGFFYFFFLAFSQKSKAPAPFRITAILLCALAFWAVQELRDYVNYLFITSIAVGVVIYFASRHLRIAPLLAILTVVSIGLAFAYQVTDPRGADDLFQLLAQMRLSFSNFQQLDIVAKSSFALDYSFHSVTDILSFLPTAISHYFYGPFVWEIVNWMQALALIETFFVIALTYPTILGIRRAFTRAPFETVVLLTFVTAFAVSQSLVISNMGTVFRHRTIAFLFLAIFTGEGIYEIGKKSYPSVFKA